MLVLPLPKGSQANPTRGAKSFLSGKFEPLGAPLSPGKSKSTGAFGKRVDWAPGTIENDRPWVSNFGVLYSYRRPKFSERCLVARHSSWKNAKVDLLRMFEGAEGAWKNWLGAPSRKSARELPEAVPLKSNSPFTIKSKTVLFW